MPSSNSRTAYEDCFDLWNRALDSPRGIQVLISDFGAARHLRTRLHYARSLDRAQSREVYEVEDPQYGTSPFDPLVVRFREHDGRCWVRIEHRTVNLADVQEIVAE